MSWSQDLGRPLPPVASAAGRSEIGWSWPPTRGQLETTKLVLELLLLVLALPWVLYRLLTNPVDLVRHLGRHHEA